MTRSEQIAALRLPLEQLPDPLPIPVIERPFRVTIHPPGSKSLTNRALLLAALADGESVLRNALVEADDARVMIAALQQLGARIVERAGDLHITGVGGRWHVPSQGVTLDLKNAGTATRFLTAAAILAPPGPEGAGGITIDGNARMRERPIGDLVDLLTALGVRSRYLAQDGCPPVHVDPPADLGALNPIITAGRTASSQFISALMLITPFLPRGLHLRLTEPPPSVSYIRMTDELIRTLGIRHLFQEFAVKLAPAGPCEVFVRPAPSPQGAHGGGVHAGATHGGAEGRGLPARGRVPAFVYDVEPDASGASYFWAAPLMARGSSCTIEGLGRSSLQGDVGIARVLEHLGATVHADERAIAVSCDQRGGGPREPLIADLSLMPDAIMTLAVVCSFAPGNSLVGGASTLRVKETDRIAALATELAKLGVVAEPVGVGKDESLRISPPARAIDCSPTAPRVEFDTYDDHRMAMSLALIGLRRPNIFIRNPACVSKTYPSFWRDLSTLYESS